MGIRLLTAVDQLIAFKDGVVAFFSGFNVLFANTVLQLQALKVRNPP